jgi:uncharacterized protein
MDRAISMLHEIAPSLAAAEPADLRPAIVITGAASGIGRELARMAALDGSFLLLVDRARQQLDTVIGELSGYGVGTAALCIDLASRDSVRCIDGALRERKLYCDVLVNCAGFGVFGAAAEVPETEQMELLDVNVRALAELTLHFLPAMVARRRGGVLNVGSITGYAPGPNMAVYYASKAFVNSFSAALAAELAGTGVTVSCLAPGVVTTPFFDRCAGAQTRLFSLMPTSTAFDTAVAGWLGFKAGKPLVTPKLRNQLVVTLARLLPRSVVLRLVRSLQAPR